jgi:hypothetical protein
LHPANPATPAVADTGFVVHVNDAPAVPVPVVIANAIAAELPVTVFPAASCTVTTGCCPNAVPLAAVVLGCVVKASLAAAPTVMLKLLLVADVSPALVAVSV